MACVWCENERAMKSENCDQDKCGRTYTLIYPHLFYTPCDKECVLVYVVAFGKESFFLSVMQPSVRYVCVCCPASSFLLLLSGVFGVCDMERSDLEIDRIWRGVRRKRRRGEGEGKIGRHCCVCLCLCFVYVFVCVCFFMKNAGTLLMPPGGGERSHGRSKRHTATDTHTHNTHPHQQQHLKTLHSLPSASMQHLIISSSIPITYTHIYTYTRIHIHTGMPMLRPHDNKR